MTTLQTNKGIWIAVKLPIDAQDISIEKEDMYYKSDVWNLGAIGHLKKLPPGGQWQILGWSDELTEEQMEGIVELCKHDRRYKAYADYVDIKDEGTANYDGVCCPTVILSFQSLLISHSITGRALILERIIDNKK